MIQAIIFDCFGVLATEGWLPFKNKYFGHDRALMAEASDLIQQANAGFLSHTDFIKAVSDMAKTSVAEVEDLLSRNVPNEPLFSYIEELKKEYKIGFLSNSVSNRLTTIFSEAQIGLFDAIVLSYETGTAKPDPAIYQLTADRLSVDPAACVFIDDQEWYAAASEEVGMTGIYYQTFEQTQADLKQILAK